MIPKHFSLVKEHPQSYEIHDKRDGSRFHVAKSGIDLGMHGELSKIQRFDDGGTVEAKPRPTLGSIINYPGADKTAPDPKPKPVQHFNDGGDALPEAGVTPPSPSEIPYETLIPQEQAQNVPYGTAPAQAQPPVEAAPPVTAAPRSVAPQAADPGTSILSDQAAAGKDALQNERNMLMEGARAEATQGNKTAEIQKAFNEKFDRMATPEDILGKNKAMNEQLFKSYMDKTIDPNHYWKSQSLPSAVATGLGMILGGMGAGMTGGPNYALQMINNSIERDIDAQKNDQSKSMNLWKMNREATQDDMQANLATQTQMLLGVKAKAMQFASEAQGPVAMARIAPMIGQLDQAINQKTMMTSLLSAGSSGHVLNTDPANLLSMVPEHQRAEATKEVAAAKQWSNFHQHLNDTFNKIKEINTPANRLLNPIQAANQVAALRDNAAVELARDEAGRVNEYEFAAAQKAFHQIGDNPDSDAVKHKNLMDIHNKKKPTGDAFKGALGIGLDRFKSTSTPGSTASIPQSSIQTATKDGVTYQKAPGGWLPVQQK